MLTRALPRFSLTVIPERHPSWERLWERPALRSVTQSFGRGMGEILGEIPPEVGTLRHGDFLSHGCAGIEGAMVMTGRFNSGLLRVR
jgi:hypothetical protein